MCGTSEALVYILKLQVLTKLGFQKYEIYAILNVKIYIHENVQLDCLLNV